jgi:hypothetical protein
MKKRAFVFSTDAMFSLIALFMLLSLLVMLSSPNEIAISGNISQRLNDAAVVSLYTGMDASDWRAAGLMVTTIPPVTSPAYACVPIFSYSSAETPSENFCLSEADIA